MNNKVNRKETKTYLKNEFIVSNGLLNLSKVLMHPIGSFALQDYYYYYYWNGLPG